MLHFMVQTAVFYHKHDQFGDSIEDFMCIFELLDFTCRNVVKSVRNYVP